MAGSDTERAAEPKDTVESVAERLATTVGGDKTPSGGSADGGAPSAAGRETADSQTPIQGADAAMIEAAKTLGDISPSGKNTLRFPSTPGTVKSKNRERSNVREGEGSPAGMEASEESVMGIDINIVECRTEPKMINPLDVAKPESTSRLVQEARVRDLVSKISTEGFLETGTRMTICETMGSDGRKKLQCIDGGHRISALQSIVENKPTVADRWRLRSISVDFIRPPGTREMFHPLEVMRISQKLNEKTHDVIEVSIADHVCTVMKFMMMKGLMKAKVNVCTKVVVENKVIPGCQEGIMMKYVSIAQGFGDVNNPAFEHWSAIPSRFATETSPPDSKNMQGCTVDVLFASAFRKASVDTKLVILELTAMWTMWKRRKGDGGISLKTCAQKWCYSMCEIYDILEKAVRKENSWHSSPHPCFRKLHEVPEPGGRTRKTIRYRILTVLKDFYPSDAPTGRGIRAALTRSMMKEIRYVVFNGPILSDDSLDHSVAPEIGVQERRTRRKSLEGNTAPQPRQQSASYGDTSNAAIDRSDVVQSPNVLTQQQTQGSLEISDRVNAEVGAATQVGEEATGKAADSESAKQVTTDRAVPTAPTENNSSKPGDCEVGDVLQKNVGTQELEPTGANRGRNDHGDENDLQQSPSPVAAGSATLRPEQGGKSPANMSVGHPRTGRDGEGGPESRKSDGSGTKDVREECPEHSSGRTTEDPMKGVRNQGDGTGDAMLSTADVGLPVLPELEDTETPVTSSTPRKLMTAKHSSGFVPLKAKPRNTETPPMILRSKRKLVDVTPQEVIDLVGEDTSRPRQKKKQKMREDANLQSGKDAAVHAVQGGQYSDRQQNDVPDKDVEEGIEAKLPVIIHPDSRMKYYVNGKLVDTLRAEVAEAAASAYSAQNVSAEFLSRAYFREKRNEIDLVGFTILDGIFKSSTTADAIHELLLHFSALFEERLEDAKKNSESGDTRRDPDWTPWCMAMMDGKNSDEEGEKGRGIFITKRKSLCDDLEDNNNNLYRKKMIVELGLGICAEGLELRTSGKDPMAFPSTGTTLVLTGERTKPRAGHTDYEVGIDEVNSPPSPPSYFMMSSGADGFGLVLAPYSHVCLSHPNRELYRVPMKRCEVPPYSVLVCRGDVYHHEEGFESNKGLQYKFPIRSHIFLKTEQHQSEEGEYVVGHWEGNSKLK